MTEPTKDSAPTEHPNLASALVAALADLCVVKAERTAKIPGKDGKQGYSYDYADIADVVRLSRPALAAHGVVALTPVSDHGSGLACTVTFLHTSGDRLDLGPFPFPHGRDAQATGSMVTYHRRYALISALGIAAGDDDDGASAVPAPRNLESPRPNPSPANGVAAGGKISVELRDRATEYLNANPKRKDDFLVAFGSKLPAKVDASHADAVEEFIKVNGDQASTTDPPVEDGAGATSATGAPSARVPKHDERPFE